MYPPQIGILLILVGTVFLGNDFSCGINVKLLVVIADSIDAYGDFTSTLLDRIGSWAEHQHTSSVGGSATICVRKDTLYFLQR